MTTTNVSGLATSPPTIPISTYDTVTVACDTSARLAEGTNSPISPVVTLLNTNGSKETIDLNSSPTVSGTQIKQVIAGSLLVAGMPYLLVWQFGDGAGNTQSTFTAIDVLI